MGSQDSFFEALGGETPTGFFTHSTDISIGVDVQGNQIGVRGTCQGPVGDGVQGHGSGDLSGVAGFGGGNGGTGVIGFGGGTQGPGVRGIGAGTQDTFAGGPDGVFGQGGPGRSGVVGQAGEGNSTACNGVAGFGSNDIGGGVFGLGGGGHGRGIVGVGANGAIPGSAGEAAGVLGSGGPGSTGVIGLAGEGNADGVRGFGTGEFSGVAGFGSGDGAGGTGVFGFGGGTQGQGVRGIGSGGPNIGAGQPAGVFGQGGAGAAGVVGTGGSRPDGPGVVGFGGGAQGAGVVGFSAGAPRGALTFSAGVFGRASPGEFGVVGDGGAQGAGTGVFGFTSGTKGAAGVAGSVLAGDGAAISGLVNPSATGALAGLFQGPVRVDGDVTVTGNTTVLGVKSAAVPFPDGSNRRLYCLESPESWFEDFGTGHFANGQAEIELDPGFASIVNSDSYHVFLTEYDDNNALYVTNRTGAGFSVRAKTSKAAAGRFSYRVVAKRKDIAGPRLERVVIPEKRPLPQLESFIDTEQKTTG